jgi:molybdopterin synthase catalytic subunit
MMLPAPSLSSLAQPAILSEVYPFIMSSTQFLAPLRPVLEKVVTHLEYQAYSKVALKTMSDIVGAARKNHTGSSHQPGPSSAAAVLHCVVHHRLGIVPVGQPSIVIAVSSPHRREAFAACEFILEEIKARVQIWKREYYKDGREEDAEWKSNTSVTDNL